MISEKDQHYGETYILKHWDNQRMLVSWVVHKQIQNCTESVYRYHKGFGTLRGYVSDTIKGFIFKT